MAKNLPEGQFQITNGPSKFDLMASLFDGKVVEITCEFTAKTSTNLHVAASFKILPKFNVIFQAVGIEDGSHDSWIGDVYFTTSNYENVRRKFYYDTRRRTGHIREI
jgi:hypothetical protein